MLTFYHYWKKVKKILREKDSSIPFSAEKTAEKGKGFYYNGTRYIHYSSLDRHDTALYAFSLEQLLIVDLLLFIITIGLMSNFRVTVILCISLLTGLYFCDLLFNLLLVFRGFMKHTEITVSEEELHHATNRDWPMYTILCPLYKEWDIVSQFVLAMSALDYPKNRLQVLLLLEESDHETIEKIETFSLPYYFQTVIIPHSLPKTKPKALNYGLQLSVGEYIVVYDAEDIPEIKQLQKTVLAFEKTEENTVCIQAKLNFYNATQNLLTKLFTAEYSLWFDLVLTGLQSINGPIPLGGTSNHFRLHDIKRLKGWDAFNVTEDCDLGMRLVRKGYKTAMINSTTLEEANSQMHNWFQQRSRWIKGYIQTYLVHTRKPFRFRNQKSHINRLLFHLVVGGKILSMFINPVMWILTILYFTFRHRTGLVIEAFFPAPVLYPGVTCLIFGNFLYLYYYMLGAAKREDYMLIKYVLLVPFYWLAMSTAAWIAVYSLIVKPHYWAKTQHGFHLRGLFSRDKKEQLPEVKQLTRYPPNMIGL